MTIQASTKPNWATRQKLLTKIREEIQIKLFNTIIVNERLTKEDAIWIAKSLERHIVNDDWKE